MKQFTAQCPLCGAWNRRLYLEETRGWMECVGCGRVVRALVSLSDRVVPPPTPEQLLQLRPETGE